MNNFIVLYSLAAFIFILLNLFGSYMYKKVNKSSYSFLSHFPFELFNIKNNVRLTAFKCLYIFPLLLLAGAYSSILFINNSLANPLIIFGLILLMLSLFSFVSLIFLNSNNIKLFILLFVLHFIPSIIILTISIYLSFSHIDYNIINLYIKELISLIIGCTFLFLLLLSFAFTSKKSWFVLEESDNNGVKTYIRPKIFPLALYQWVCILLDFISVLLIALSV